MHFVDFFQFVSYDLQRVFFSRVKTKPVSFVSFFQGVLSYIDGCILKSKIGFFQRQNRIFSVFLVFLGYSSRKNSTRCIKS